MHFIKNYEKLSAADQQTYHVHCGPVCATARAYVDIFDTRAGVHPEDLVRLQRAFDLLMDDLDAPFDLILRAEFGNGLAPVATVDDFNYLTETPFSVIQMDYAQALCAVREVYASLG